MTLLTGQSVKSTHRLHLKYGHAVRVAPNEVSFTSVDSWKAIYGFKVGQKEGYEKDMHFYPTPANGAGSLIIAKGADHGRQRRIFSHAFSEVAMREQAPLVSKYANLLIEQLQKCAQGSMTDHDGVDLTTWFNFTTFDVIGDLTYGEPFYCLETSDYHPIVRLIYGTLKATTFLNVQRRIGWLQAFIHYYVPKMVLTQRKDLVEFNTARVNSRLAREGQRSDFMTQALSALESKALSMKEIYNTAAVFSIAGSETTATTMSAATFFILTHPSVWDRLKAEVRNTFASDVEIHVSSINDNLPYMLAVLNETLRMYPPIPTGYVTFSHRECKGSLANY